MTTALRIFFIGFFTVFITSANAVGVPNSGDPIVRLYPNPATSVVNLDLGTSVNKGYSLQVFSFLGKKMHSVSNVTQRVTVNLTDYIRGVYIYQLRDRSGKLVETGKFQVSK